MNKFKKMVVAAAATASIGGAAVVADVAPVDAAGLTCTAGHDLFTGSITCPSGVYRRVLITTSNGLNFYGTCTVINGTRSSVKQAPPGTGIVTGAYVAYC